MWLGGDADSSALGSTPPSIRPVSHLRPSVFIQTLLTRFAGEKVPHRGKRDLTIPFARERDDSSQSSAFRFVASPNECLKRERGFCCSWPFGKSFPLTSHAGTYFHLTGRFEGAVPRSRDSQPLRPQTVSSWIALLPI